MNEIKMDGYSVMEDDVDSKVAHMEDDVDSKVCQGITQNETSLQDGDLDILKENEDTDEEMNEVEGDTLVVYPITLDFDPESLQMESYAGKVRKTRCWKNIIADNRKALAEFVSYVKEEFQDTSKIHISYDVLEYLKDKVMREDIHGGVLFYDASLDRSTIVLVKE